MTRRRKIADTATQALAMEHLGGSALTRSRAIRVRVTEAQLDGQLAGIAAAQRSDERGLADELSQAGLAPIAVAPDDTARWKRPAAANAARFWHQLASDADAWGVYEAQHVGSGAAHFAKARTYRETAYALALEAVTGKPHCSMCFRDHPNHHHAHRG